MMETIVLLVGAGIVLGLLTQLFRARRCKDESSGAGGSDGPSSADSAPACSDDSADCGADGGSDGGGGGDGGGD